MLEYFQTLARVIRVQRNLQEVAYGEEKEEQEEEDQDQDEETQTVSSASPFEL